MAGDRGPARAGDYRLARIAAALFLTAVLGVLLVFDALAPDYVMELPTLLAIIGAISGLLGAEAILSRGR